MCKKSKLVIEVDGYSHTHEHVLKKDIKKQTDLEKAGFVVLRFKDSDVLNQIKQIIWLKIEELEKNK